VAEDGVTTSGYGAEYAWQIRAVGWTHGQNYWGSKSRFIVTLRRISMHFGTSN